MIKYISIASGFLEMLFKQGGGISQSCMFLDKLYVTFAKTS